MGKKITLDFSKVEERSGWNSKEIPEGLHEFKIELVDLKDANDGTAMWTYGLRPTNPKYKTRLFPYYCKHQQNQLFKLRDLFTAAGLSVPKKRTALDPDAPVGKIIAAEVSDASGNYAGRSEIDGVYDRSIIEDDDQVDDENEVDDEDDEADEVDEVEDDEEYEDEADEDEEVDEDELREEIEALTLGELRKRAKGLEIDTDGVTKKDLIELVIEEELGAEDEEDSDEEDDLDDEELEDEDLEDEEFDDEEDEEEEPEPAPRRRAATAKKPAAKAAPKAEAAPARRRVVRR